MCRIIDHASDSELDDYLLTVVLLVLGIKVAVKISMMVCYFDAEYVSFLNVLHGMNFFPSTNTFLHPGNP